MTSLRFWVVCLLMMSAGAVIYGRGYTDRVPPSTPLAEFPRSLGGWNSSDIPIPQETLEVLGHGVFLNRVYEPGDQRGASNPASANQIGLFIAYFPTQRTGQAIHSPQNCMPGAGWSFQASGVLEVEGPHGQPARIGDYLIANGVNRDEVLYWYQSEGHTIANDYKAKLLTLVDSIRYARTDAALVRIVVPLAPNESRETARERALTFARNLMPILPSYVPD